MPTYICLLEETYDQKDLPEDMKLRREFIKTNTLNAANAVIQRIKDFADQNGMAKEIYSFGDPMSFIPIFSIECSVDLKNKIEATGIEGLQQIREEGRMHALHEVLDDTPKPKS